MAFANKYFFFIIYLCTYASFINAWISSFGIIKTSQYRHKVLRMVFKPTTYTPFPIVDKKLNKEVTILVKTGEANSLKILDSWSQSGLVDETEAKRLEQEGIIIRLGASSTDTAVTFSEPSPPSSATSSSSASSMSSGVSNNRSMRPRTSTSHSGYASYVNVGDDSEPVYLHSSKLSSVDDLRAGRITVEQLIEKGVAFTNVTELFLSEKKLNRRDSIATRVKDEFAMSSPVWQRWTDKTDITNTTSLSQVIAEYFQTQSIGDIGGKNVEYIPRRGYPGTLAPGELFKDDSPPDLLPKRLMHPWPAMQEIQFHGRNPVSHPMIPPPVLWAGMNNMFLNNLTTTVLRDSSPTQPVTGGQSMNPADAILIARYATFGKSYEPSQQIKHGGSIFTSGRQIPNYHPDHGPTISDEEAEPPIPKELRPLIERWYSPYDDRDSVDPKTEKEIESQELAATEEEERRAKFEAMYESMQGNLWAIEERKEAEERKAAIEDRYMQLYTRELDRMRVLNMVDMVDIEEITSFTSSISPHGSTGKKKPKTPSRRGKRKDGTIDPIDDSNMDEFSIDDRINSIESVDDDITALMSPSIPATDVSEISLSSDETNESAHEATLISTDRDSTDDSSVTQEPGEDAGEAFPKAQRDEWMAKATREVTLQREVMAAASEKIVRFKRPLTQYVIAMMRERNIDVIDAERNVQLASNSKKKGRRRKSKKSTDGDTSEVEGVIEAALSMEEPELDSEGLGLIPDTDGPTDGDTDLILGSDSVILDSELDDLSIVLGTDDDDSDLDTFIGIV